MDFSFTEYNFGPCFLHRVDMPAKQATLTITNKDSRDVRWEGILVTRIDENKMLLLLKQTLETE